MLKWKCQNLDGLFVLLHMRRQIHGLVIGMYKGTIHHRYTLEDVLQTLAEVVAVAQARVLGEHNVDLDVEFVASVVGLEALDLFDRLREAHRHVQQHVPLICRSGGAAQIAHVRRGGGAPVVDDVEGEEEAAQGVCPPDAGVEADQGKDNAKGVEDAVGHRVLGERLDAGVLHQAAPEPTEAFDDNCPQVC